MSHAKAIQSENGRVTVPMGPGSPEYDFDIIYRKVLFNSNADALSPHEYT